MRISEIVIRLVFVSLFPVAGVGQVTAGSRQPAPTVVHCFRNPVTGILNAKAFAKHSTSFRQAAEKAWRATHNGDAPFEAGFSIDDDGHPGKVQLSIFETVNAATHLNIVANSSSLGTLHVHNQFGKSTPSPDDIASAKKWGMPLYVESRTGLYVVNPNGMICHLYAESDWFSELSVNQICQSELRKVR